MTVMDELIEWNHKYQTYMRRYIEVTPARRDLCFAPTADHWKLLLRQEESLHRQIERKTRLLWAMQEEDRQRRGDAQWQEIVAQAAENPTNPGTGPGRRVGQERGRRGNGDCEEIQRNSGTKPSSS